MSETVKTSGKAKISVPAKSKDVDIDTSISPEVRDWSQAIQGRFYRAAVQKSRQPQPSTGVSTLPQTEIGDLIHLLGRNQEASEEFIRRSRLSITATVMRTLLRFGSANPGAVEDLVQEVFLKLLQRDGLLLKKLEFKHEGAVFGFLKLFARNVAVDYCRAMNAERRGANSPEPATIQLKIEASAGPQIETQILYEQIDRVLRDNATQRDHKVFSLYYRHGMTASEISRLPEIDLTVKGVESTLFRLTKLVRSRLAEKRQRKPRS